MHELGREAGGRARGKEFLKSLEKGRGGARVRPVSTRPQHREPKKLSLSPAPGDEIAEGLTIRHGGHCTGRMPKEEGAHMGGNLSRFEEGKKSGQTRREVRKRKGKRANVH